MPKKIVIVGSGNAALSAGIAALEKGADVTIYEKADKKMAGGNTKYTAGAMRFAYDNGEELMPLLKNPNENNSAISFEEGFKTMKLINECFFKTYENRKK